MEDLHARYPFLKAARASVESADVDLASIAVEDGPIPERATERVRSAIEDGSVGPSHRSERVELLSYPVARVLVSLVDESGLRYRYARAEADTAQERFVADIEGDDELRSVGRDRITLETLLADFELEDAVDLDPTAASEASSERIDSRTGTQSLVSVDVGVYLRLTEDLSESAWELPRRSLDGGNVLVSREELYELLREMIRQRVAADLPLSVPDSIASSLSDRVETLRSMLADHDHDWDIGRIDPEAFPPCIQALLDRASGEESFPAHSQFSLLTFLLTIGMDSSEIVATVGEHPDVDPDRLSDRVDLLRESDGTSAYPPPICATMVAYGDCVNTDALCEQISHPLDYYERRLSGEHPE